MDGTYTGTAGDANPDAAEAITLAFTIVESEQPLTKRYKLGANGAIERKGSGAFYAGEARRVEVTGASASTLLAAVAEHIKGLSEREAVIPAPPPNGRVKWDVVTQDKANRADGTIARTKEDFAAPSGPCLLMLDCDTKTYPDEIKKRLAAEGGLWAVLTEVCPALGRSACFMRPSVSSNITASKSGISTGDAGQHLYLIAADGKDVDGFAKRLHMHLRLKGWGWHELDAAGRPLERSLIDPSASAPYRIVYEAAAVLEPGLEQPERKPKGINKHGGMVDTASLPPLSAGEVSDLEDIAEAWRKEHSAEIAEAETAYRERRARDLEARGVSPERARRAVDSAIRTGELDGDIDIHLDTGEVVSVADIFAERAKYHKRTCADPIEREYGGGRNLAVIYTDGAYPIIFTHAHHGTTYRLLDSPERWFQPVAAKDSAVEKRRARGFELVRLRDLELREPEYLVRGLVETDSVAVLFGDPASGKSLFAIDIAACVASGKAFHGRPVRSGPVVYIAGEGHNGIRRRVSAWEKHTGLDLNDAPFFLSRSAARLLDEDSVESVAEELRVAAATDGPPALIVIDTLARNYGSGDENNTSDMNRFVGAVDRLRGAYSGCTAIVVHHTGHGDKKRARGSMVLTAATDAEYRVEKKDHAVTVTNTKMKDASPPAPMHFDIEPVTLVVASNGEEITSAVLAATERPSKVVAIRLSPSEALGLEAFADASPGGVRGEAATEAVHVEDWRAEFYARHTGDNESTKRKAFQRVRKSLCRKKLLAVEGEFYVPGTTKWPL